MKGNELASVLIGLLQGCQRNRTTQITISTKVTDGVTWLTVKDDGIGVFELESKYINAQEIKIEHDNVNQGRKISFPLSVSELANLSKIIELPAKYSPIPLMFNGEKFGGVSYFVSEAMQKIVFNPTSL